MIKADRSIRSMSMFFVVTFRPSHLHEPARIHFLGRKITTIKITFHPEKCQEIQIKQVTSVLRVSLLKTESIENQ